ncbi:hypothetical protein M011DRAFT_471008 [Sporormia fimetaria CBS 119925]|uniref:Uncharacterized protein n=1 Tax=Sporormia fimetaria CBS 119925 TaxID=1340428 RepID=A0A6A6V3K5_9PLEO|nr:hypothetical protein M011DRAFT_471008 [Sporormia fimetaria CBS 119925]
MSNLPLNSDTSGVQRSPLLLLPPEMRDEVYAYVFRASPGGIRYAWNLGSVVSSKFSKRGDRPKKAINQLKYVCRQLYYETADLELKKNKAIHLHKGREDEPEALSQFFVFMSNCHRVKMDWINTVILETSMEAIPEYYDWNYDVAYLEILRPSDIELLPHLDRICKTRPNTQFKFVVPYFHHEATLWGAWPLLRGMIELARCLRNTDYTFLKNNCLEAMEVPLDARWADHWIVEAPARQLYRHMKARNLKFVAGGAFEDESFRAQILEDFVECDHGMPWYPAECPGPANEALDACVKQMKEWAERGI